MKFSTISTIYILFVFFIPNSISLVNKPGVPLISVSRLYILIWIILFLWFIFTRGRVRRALLTYPFYKPMLIVILSMVVVTVFAQNLLASINPMLSFLTESFILSVMIWVAYRRPEDITRIMHSMILIFVGLSIYGTVSYLIGVNPIVNFVNEYFSTDSRKFALSYSDSERIGLLGRAQSIFPHAIQYGALLVMALSISYYHYIKDTGARKYLNFLYMAILVVGIATTNSRTPFIFLLVILCIYFYYQNISHKLKIGAIALMVASVVIPFVNDATVQLITSIFIEISGGESGVGGSSISMRLEQLSASLLLFNESPIVGHGMAATRLMLESGTQPAELRKAESFLFSQMIDAGSLGVMSYAYFYLFLTYYFLKQKKYLMDRYLAQFAIIIGALILGYAVFILATGVLDTFQLFIIIITLGSRYIYLKLHPACSIRKIVISH